MLSKKDVKLIKSLAQKKFRQQLGLFVVEGKKGIDEFINSDFQQETLYATEDIFSVDYIQISEQELSKISQLKSPNKALAVYKIPSINETKIKGLTIVLDDVRDPGNLGTIIRLCDWYGIENLLCSKATVDCYNPKVVQASMGSLTRVKITYLDLNEFLKTTKMEIFGTFMDGKNIYKENLPSDAVIILGNEANGISQNLEKLVNKKLSIPRFGKLKSTESLNVATAASIVLSEFRRNV